MTEENLKTYNEKLKELSIEEQIERNNYLFDIMTGVIAGPTTGYPTIDKPWITFYDKDKINEVMPSTTAYLYMYYNNEKYLDQIAIEYFNNKITFRELFKRIEETQKALVQNGVRQGDYVSICSVTTPEVIYLFYALNRIGAIANMIDPRTNEERLITIINKTKSKMLFYLDLIEPKIDKMMPSLNVKKYVRLSPFDSLKFPANVILKAKNKKKRYISNAFSYGEFYKDCKYILSCEDMKYVPNYPAAVVYTGGTTGVAKGAILTNDNLNAMAYHYSTANLGIERGQTVLDIMPPFIAYGLDNGIHLPLSVGIRCIIIPKFEPEKFPDYMIKYKPNIVLGVPSHFDILTKSKKLKNEDLSYLIYPAAGGDAMNLSLEGRLNEFLKNHNCKSKMTKGYGMTELSGAAITSSLTANKVGSVGIPFPTNIVGIFKEGTDIELPIGEVGEICITGPTMFKSYLDNEEEDEKVKKKHIDGKMWIHSGDYGYIDREGFLYVKGRIKRTIVRPDGHNNYPLEIETIINSVDGVQNSAVVDMSADKYGNGHIPVAFVVANNGVDKEELHKEISEYCAKYLPNRDIACNYMFIDELPLTNIGKVDYKKLLELLKEMLEKNKELKEEIYSNYEKTLELK